MKNIVLTFAAAALALFPCAGSLSAQDIAALANRHREVAAEKILHDADTVLLYRRGLEDTLRYVKEHPELFPEKRTDARVLNAGSKDAVRRAWIHFLDHYLALDSLIKYYTSFYGISYFDEKNEAFDVYYAAFLAEYRFALEFIERAENDRGLAVLLNDKVPGLGLAAGSYSDFKYRFLNAAAAARFAAATTVGRTTGKHQAALQAAIDEDAALIWRMGLGRGEALTLVNAVDVLKDTGFTVYFPVQAGISTWMGDTKVHRPGRSLIKPAQLDDVLSRCEPGDIFVERREWYLSNIGLPGFWTHAALYVGTPDERSRYFDDPSVKEWVKQQGQEDGDFEALLRSRYPDANALSRELHDDIPPRICEAIGEGVLFTTLQHTADCDSLAVLRPRLGKKDKAIALLRAFQYSGRPYDFNFDFLTDSALVCTELVYKSYEKGDGCSGLDLAAHDYMGHMLLSANDIVEFYDRECDKPGRQLDYVLFLDGNEKHNAAFPADEAALRGSWKRPKWHILVSDAH